MKIGDIEFTIGADPEFAVFNKKTKEYVPAVGLVPGTKLNPYALAVGDVQLDGTAVEIGIPPCKTAKEFVDSIHTTKGIVQGMIQEINPDLVLHTVPHVIYNQRVLSETPPEAFISGCEPDFWLGHKEDLSDIGSTPPKKGNFGEASFGGHIHIGWTSGKSIDDPLHVSDCQTVVAALSLVHHNYLKSYYPVVNKVRATIGYGTPTSYRVKPYGVEFRAPSNWWCDTKQDTHEMFKLVEEALLLVVRSNNSKTIQEHLRTLSSNIKPPSSFTKRVEMWCKKYKRQLEKLDARQSW